MRRGDFQGRGDARGSGRGDARGSGRGGRGRRDRGCEGRGVGRMARARDGSGSETGAETVETSARARFRELRLTDAHGALADGGF